MYLYLPRQMIAKNFRHSCELLQNTIRYRRRMTWARPWFAFIFINFIWSFKTKNQPARWLKILFRYSCHQTFSCRFQKEALPMLIKKTTFIKRNWGENFIVSRFVPRLSVLATLNRASAGTRRYFFAKFLATFTWPTPRFLNGCGFLPEITHEASWDKGCMWVQCKKNV